MNTIRKAIGLVILGVPLALGLAPTLAQLPFSAGTEERANLQYNVGTELAQLPFSAGTEERADLQYNVGTEQRG